MNLANLKLAQVQRDIAMNRHELGVAKRNLARSRKTIAHRLVTLYTRGSTSTLDVILGAQNLERDDRADRHREPRLVGRRRRSRARWQQFQLAVLRNAPRARDREAPRSGGSSPSARQQQRAIEVQLGERRTLLSSLNGEVQRLIAAQQAAQLRAARAAQARSPTCRRAGDADLRRDGCRGDRRDARGRDRRAAVELLRRRRRRDVVPRHARTCGRAPRRAGSTAPASSCTPTRRSASRCRTRRTRCGATASPVPKDQLQPGDLVFFDGLGHVGIYIGGGEFVHAPHTGTVVQVSSLDCGSYASSYVGARRVTLEAMAGDAGSEPDRPIARRTVPSSERRTLA